ncbi:MAG TPA: DUF742 domain-containing protein [Amycolatopsis sp.]|nr:DUF742 domain-containing protein [Amycolatopsis sp.]
MDAGHPTDVDGDRMEANSSGAEEPRNAPAEEDWPTFRDRVSREWRSRQTTESTSGSLVVPREQADQPETPRYGSASYQPTDFGDRLLSGPASELFGAPSPGGGAEFSAFPPVSPGPPSQPSMPSQPSRPNPSEISDQAAAVPGYPGIPSTPAAVPPPVPAETSGLVRPYFRTGGRTRPSQDLAVEALISTSERGRAIGRVRVPEHRSICSLCLDTRSVAEVAAYLRLPLGVVRVLIGDVAGLGLVLVHSTTSAVGDRPNIDFMERVLSGLRRI